MPELRVWTGPSANVTYLGFNLRDPILGRRAVRHAIAHAIDRDGIVRHKLRGQARLARALLPPGHRFVADDLPAYEHDPAMARALLDEAGYPDPDGDGPLPRFRVTYKTSTNRFRRSIAMAIARRRIEAGSNATGFIEDVLQSRSIQVLPITPEIAVLAQSDEFAHGDPADRIIAATALSRRAPLVSADDRLRRMSGLKVIW